MLWASGVAQLLGGRARGGVIALGLGGRGGRSGRFEFMADDCLGRLVGVAGEVGDGALGVAGTVAGALVSWVCVRCALASGTAPSSIGSAPAVSALDVLGGSSAKGGRSSSGAGVVGRVGSAGHPPPPGAGAGEECAVGRRLEAAAASRAPPSSVVHAGWRARRVVARGAPAWGAVSDSATVVATVIRAWRAVGLRRGASDCCGGCCGGLGVIWCGWAGCGDDVGCGCGCTGVGIGVGVGGGDGDWDAGGRASVACSLSQPGVWQGRPHATPNCPGHRGHHVPWGNRDRRGHPGVVQVPVSVSIGTTGVCCEAVSSLGAAQVWCCWTGSLCAVTDRGRLVPTAGAGGSLAPVAFASSAACVAGVGSPCAPAPPVPWLTFGRAVGQPSGVSAAGPS